MGRRERQGLAHWASWVAFSVAFHGLGAALLAHMPAQPPPEPLRVYELEPRPTQAVWQPRPKDEAGQTERRTPHPPATSPPPRPEPPTRTDPPERRRARRRRTHARRPEQARRHRSRPVSQASAPAEERQPAPRLGPPRRDLQPARVGANQPLEARSGANQRVEAPARQARTRPGPLASLRSRPRSASQPSRRRIDYAALVSRVQAAVRRHLRYPARARRLGLEGTVRLRFWLDHAGRILRIRVLSSAGSVLDREAIRALRAAQPLPPYPGPVEIPIRFRLQD